nr:outer membrane beta-barrel protein [Caldovatus aquaticus]
MGAAARGLLLLAGVAGLPALAQTFPPESTARGVTVQTRPRPEFDPLGVRAGAFRLDAAAEAGLSYNDNVFATRRDRTGDGFGAWSLDAGLRSDWTRHGVGVTASYSEVRHFSQTILDWRDWSVGAFGRLDIGGSSSVEARYNHLRQHLDVFSVDIQQAGLSRPAPYDVDEFQVSGNARLNRLFLTGLLNYRIYQFEDVSFGNRVAPLSQNDHKTWLAALGSGYALAPGRLVTLIGRIQEIRYDDAISRGRDSFTWEILTGFQYDFDGVWQARFGIGYRQRNYDSPQIKNLEGLALEGEVIWTPTLLTTVTFGVRRTVEESIALSQVSYTRSLAQLRVDHELLRNVILGAELGFDRREYETHLRATDMYTILSGRWLINRNMSLSASYQFLTRIEAKGGAEEYYRNLFQVRLRFAL